MDVIRKLMTKKHKAVIDENLEVQLLDKGIEVRSEPFEMDLKEESDFLDAARQIGESNRKTLRIQKAIRQKGEEFEVYQVYLV